MKTDVFPYIVNPRESNSVTVRLSSELWPELKLLTPGESLLKERGLSSIEPTILWPLARKSA